MEFPTADAEGTGRVFAQVWMRLISMALRYDVIGMNGEVGIEG